MINVKKFFETPKKAILSTVCIAAALAVLGSGSVLAANVAAKSSAIGEANAQNYAFADAGVDPASATILKTEFDFDDGHFLYEIDFLANGYEYEYQVRSSDGRILKRELEPTGAVMTAQAAAAQNQTQNTALQDETTQNAAAQGGVQNQTQNAAAQNSTAQNAAAQSGVQNQTQNAAAQSSVQNQTQNAAAQNTAAQNAAPANNTQASAQISLDDAKNTALSDAGVSAADVTYTKDHLDYDDGISVYEIEFYTANQSYDYEIDATTGAVRKKSIESFQSPAGTNAGVQNSGSYIDADAAKSIALNHAGLSSSDVTFSKTKLEMDDGYTCYEVEFYHGRTEYDYKIDAASGNILEFDSEID